MNTLKKKLPIAFAIVCMFIATISLAYVSAQINVGSGDVNEGDVVIVPPTPPVVGGGNTTIDASNASIQNFSDGVYLRLDASNDPVVNEVNFSGGIDIPNNQQIVSDALNVLQATTETLLFGGSHNEISLTGVSNVSLITPLAWLNTSLEVEGTSLFEDTMEVKGGNGRIISTGSGGAISAQTESGQAGFISFGNTADIGISSDGVEGTWDSDGTMVFKQKASNPDSIIEYLFIEEAGDFRLAIPGSGVDYALGNPRSMIIGYGAHNNESDVICSANGFTEIDCDTGGTGGDLGIADDLEVLGTIYGDGSGITGAPASNAFDQDLNTTSNVTFAGLNVDGLSEIAGNVTFRNANFSSNISYSQSSTRNNCIRWDANPESLHSAICRTSPGTLSFQTTVLQFFASETTFGRGTSSGALITLDTSTLDGTLKWTDNVGGGEWEMGTAGSTTGLFIPRYSYSPFFRQYNKSIAQIGIFGHIKEHVNSYLLEAESNITIDVTNDFIVNADVEVGQNLSVEQDNKVCLDGQTCNHYITYNGTDTIWT